MQTTKKQNLQRELRPLFLRFEKWRQLNGSRGRRIPDALWDDAADAAKHYGICSVAEYLKLSYYSLKAKLPPAESVEDSRRGNPTKFIELLRPELPLAEGAKAINSIDITKKNGSKVRIEFGGVMSPELSKLTERLWRLSR